MNTLYSQAGLVPTEQIALTLLHRGQTSREEIAKRLGVPLFKVNQAIRTGSEKILRRVQRFGR